MECEVCQLKTELIDCLQCQNSKCIHCTISCLVPKHDLRESRICSNCEMRTAASICSTCSRIPLCHQCHTKTHLQHQVLQMRWLPPPLLLEKVDGLYNVQAILPERKAQPLLNPLPALKRRIMKMLQLAANPGTEAEGVHAKKLAVRWLMKHQLSQDDLTEDTQQVVTYDIIMTYKGSLSERSRRLYQRSCTLWLAELANRVTELFPDLVENYVKTRDTIVFGSDHTKCFSGKEYLAWATTELFVQLSSLISKYIQIALRIGRCTSTKSAESYALGLVSGIQITKEMREVKQSHLQIQPIGKKHRPFSVDWCSYQQGKEDAKPFRADTRMNISH